MKNSKNIMIIALLIAVVALAVGYAAFATQLTINGHATIDADWDVEIISITPSYSGTAEEATNTPTTPKFTATTATFDTVLKKPGDYAEYTVVVENKGSIDAKLNSVTTTPTLPDGSTPSVIIYSITEKPADNSALDAGDTATYKFKVEFDSNATAETISALTTPIEKSFTATIEYIQKD